MNLKLHLVGEKNIPKIKIPNFWKMSNKKFGEGAISLGRGGERIMSWSSSLNIYRYPPELLQHRSPILLQGLIKSNVAFEIGQC